MTGIFRLPWDMVLAPIYEYGSGQPWNHRLGYDFNGDGKNSDRLAGVERNDEEGPEFRQLGLRLTKGFQLFADQRLEVIAEGFNVLDTANYDVGREIQLWLRWVFYLGGALATLPGTGQWSVGFQQEALDVGQGSVRPLQHREVAAPGIPPQARARQLGGEPLAEVDGTDPVVLAPEQEGGLP
jgi:hypothetical protein